MSRKSINGRNFVKSLDTNNLQAKDIDNNNIVSNNINSGSGTFGSLFADIFNLSGTLVFNNIDTILGDGAGKDEISISNVITYLNTSGGTSDATLAVGEEGQIKIITMIISGSSADLDTTDGNLVSTITNINFSAVGDSVILLYTSVGWIILGSRGVTIT